MMNSEREAARRAAGLSKGDLQGWSASGFLSVGANQPVGPNAVESVKLAVNFPKPAAYTLQFFSDGLSKPNPAGTATQTLAEIIWSVAGNSVRRLISVLGAGTAISGAGEGVNARIFDFSGNTFVKSTYQVSMLLIPGLRGATAQPPILEIDNDLIRGGPVSLSINNGASGIFNIPPNAGVNQVWFSLLVNGGFIPFVESNVLFIQRISTTFILQKGGNGDVVNKWWPVSPTADQIIVQNNTGQVITVTPTWGIEG